MQYTSDAAPLRNGPMDMEERSLRDVERWKDKIEVRLDNRQVFFLFFGSALVACTLFILGVIVGKRLESRGRASAPEIEDPLALLDRVATTPPPNAGGLTFTGGLTKGGPGFGKRAKVATKEEPKVEPKAEEVKAEAKPEAKPEPKREPAAAEAAHPADPKPAEAAIPATTPPPVEASVPASGSPLAKAGRFTLQLASFQTREEAESFAKSFTDASPYVTESNIPGKGRWFRVRLGQFDSNADAVAAKADFERKHKAIAYLAPL